MTFLFEVGDDLSAVLWEPVESVSFAIDEVLNRIDDRTLVKKTI